MAQINITLNQDEVLRLLASSDGDAFRLMLQESMNAFLKAESDEQLGCARYERSEARTDSRNGARERPLTTRVGTVELTVPRHRNQPFRTMLFENYRRSEAALVTAMAEMVVAGVSTAKVGRVMEEICGKSFSKQSVSEACKELDAAVGRFRSRPLEGDYLFVMADATYLKVREDHRVRAKALLIAVGLRRDGRKEVLGVDLADGETRASWSEFLGSLRARGLASLRMLTSDACEGLVSALQEVWPGVPWQRCQAHLARNVTDKAPKHLRAGLASELADMFNQPDLASARRRMAEVEADYSELAPASVECLREGFQDAMTVMALPAGMRRPTRTSNYIERLNKEVKRRARVVGVFPNAASALRLAGALLMETDERWARAGKAYYSPACAELDARAGELSSIAEEQRRLRKAK